LEKVACGAFSDSGFVAAGKRRDFCQLRYGRTFEFRILNLLGY
jgi:hypothetical protein